MIGWLVLGVTCGIPINHHCDRLWLLFFLSNIRLGKNKIILAKTIRHHFGAVIATC